MTPSNIHMQCIMQFVFINTTYLSFQLRLLPSFEVLFLLSLFPFLLHLLFLLPSYPLVLAYLACRYLHPQATAEVLYNLLLCLI